MNLRARRTRWCRSAVGSALLITTAVGSCGPALAVPAVPVPVVRATVVPATVAVAAGGTTAVPLPPLDPQAIRAALARRPEVDVTAALVRVSGSEGSFEGASGEGDFATGRPVDAAGRFRIGSISKVFATVVVLQLSGEGRLDLDGSVQQYLPDVLPKSFPPITVGELLNHTSGLPTGSQKMWGDGTTGWFEVHRSDSWTPEQVVATLRGEPTDPKQEEPRTNFQPGTAQQYNGMNTFLAGMIVERVTGHSFAREVRERIVRPLGLRQTSVPGPDDTALPHPSAHGYLTVSAPDGSTRRVDVTEQSPWPWAEGGMISSAPDLDRFFSALFQGRLLPSALQENLFTVPDLPNYENSDCGKGPSSRACLSMGLERVEQDGVVAWGKTGSRPGFTSGVFATRDLSRTVVYSVNPTALTGAEMPFVGRLLVTAFGLAPAARP